MLSGPQPHRVFFASAFLNDVKKKLKILGSLSLNLTEEQLIKVKIFCVYLNEKILPLETVNE